MHFTAQRPWALQDVGRSLAALISTPPREGRDSFSDWQMPPPSSGLLLYHRMRANLSY